METMTKNNLICHNNWWLSRNCRCPFSGGNQDQPGLWNWYDGKPGEILDTGLGAVRELVELYKPKKECVEEGEPWVQRAGI